MALNYPGVETSRSFHHGRFVSKLRAACLEHRWFLSFICQCCSINVVEGTVVKLLVGDAPLNPVKGVICKLKEQNFDGIDAAKVSTVFREVEVNH